VVQEALDFVGGQHDGQFLLQPGAGEVVLVPGHFERDQVDELHGGNESVDALWREFALLREVELVLAHSLQVQILRAAVEVLGKVGHIMGVAACVVVAKLRICMSSIMR
jgi:hypothetical protein